MNEYTHIRHGVMITMGVLIVFITEEWIEEQIKYIHLRAFLDIQDMHAKYQRCDDREY